MYALYTDTSANLSDSIVKRYGLHVIPLNYTVNGITYPSQDSAAQAFDGKLYYGLMRKGASVKTSMANTSAFSAAFINSLSNGTDVIYIGMSSGISGSHHAAAAAAAELEYQYHERKIAVIDTRAASLGEGLPVLYAARLREAGTPFDEVVSKTEQTVLPSASISQWKTLCT
jgi:DegV family protein with EDD domain